MLQQREGVEARIDRALELVVVFVVSASAIGLVATLAGHFFAPQVWILSLLLAGAYAWHTRGRPASLGPAPRWQHIALLVLIGLFFRVPAYDYVSGGQDEGVYVNMANYIARTGSIKVRDTVLERLQGSDAAAQYMQDNRVTGTASDEYGAGIYLPGVYLHTPGGAKLEFQFYHLFPVWMALFGGAFGIGFGVYALTFFALLSILFFHRLALIMTRSHEAALMAGLLLALSPLHAFFSKFPVTEVPALAFSTAGFAYLVAYWSAEERRQRRWLWLSAAAFAGLFFTRISGLMYLPFVVALAVAASTSDADAERRRGVVRWAIAVVGFYLVSVAYGLHWSHRYATDIYRFFFAGPFGPHWRVYAIAVLMLGLMAWWGLARVAARPGGGELIRRYLLQPGLVAVGALVLVGLAVGLLKVYRLGWTTHYAADRWLATVWGLAGSGWNAARASSLAGLIVYAGPLLPLLFLGWVLRRQADPRAEFLRVFLAGFFVYTAVLQWTIPYGPYYARYLLSELVPYLILFVVCRWAAMPSGRGRLAVTAALVLSATYAGATTMSQIGKQENAGLHAALIRLVAGVDKSDVVLLESTSPLLPQTSEIRTPLLYTFGLNVVAIDPSRLHDHGYIAALDARYDDLFLISRSPKTLQGYSMIESTRARIWAFCWGHAAPKRFCLQEDMRLYLSRLDRPIFPPGTVEYFNSSGSWNAWLVRGWNNPENWGVWSQGHHASIEIDPRQLPSGENGVTLRFEMQAFLTQNHLSQHFRVRLNGDSVGDYAVVHPNNHVSVQIKLGHDYLESANKIVIDFDLPDAISPKAAGMNDDTRVLGVGLISATVVPNPSSVTDEAAVPAGAAAAKTDKRREAAGQLPRRR